MRVMGALRVGGLLWWSGRQLSAGRLDRPESFIHPRPTPPGYILLSYIRRGLSRAGGARLPIILGGIISRMVSETHRRRL